MSGVTTQTSSGPGSDGNEEVLHIPQSSCITGTSRCLMSYLEHSFDGWSYPSAKVQSVYSTVPADWATRFEYVYCQNFMTPALEIWGIWSTPSLPLLTSPLWLEVLVFDWVLAIGQIEQKKNYMCKQMTDVELWLSYSNTWNHLTVGKKWSQARLKMLSTKYVHKWFGFFV